MEPVPLPQLGSFLRTRTDLHEQQIEQIEKMTTQDPWLSNIDVIEVRNKTMPEFIVRDNRIPVDQAIRHRIIFIDGGFTINGRFFTDPMELPIYLILETNFSHQRAAGELVTLFRKIWNELPKEENGAVSSGGVEPSQTSVPISEETPC
jgi:hypothetical protein